METVTGVSHMDKDTANTWLVIVSIAAIIFGFGWYSAAKSDGTSSSSSDYSEEVTDSDGNTFGNYQDRIDEYESALTEANDTIQQQNSCSDDVFSALENGDFDNAYEYVQDCSGDEVSSPGTSI